MFCDSKMSTTHRKRIPGNFILQSPRPFQIFFWKNPTFEIGVLKALCFSVIFNFAAIKRFAQFSNKLLMTILQITEVSVYCRWKSSELRCFEIGNSAHALHVLFAIRAIRIWIYMGLYLAYYWNRDIEKREIAKAREIALTFRTICNNALKINNSIPVIAHF